MAANESDETEAPRSGESADASSAFAFWDRCKLLLLGMYEDAFTNRIIDVAAAIAFYALLAIFPGIAAFVSLYALFADAASIADHLAWASYILPAGTWELLSDQIHYLTREPQTSLSLTFAIGLLISLWSANSGLLSLIDALNIIHSEFERRTWVSLYVVSFAFTGGSIFLALMTFAAVIAIPLLLAHLGLTQEAIGLAFSWIRWPILFVAVIALLCLLYLFGPSRPTARLGDVFYGAVGAAVLSLATSLIFSWYVASFGTFSATYGSLGAVAGFLVWLWLTALIVLLGALFNVGLFKLRQISSVERTNERSIPLSEQKSDQ
jgi:membrane protein